MKRFAEQHDFSFPYIIDETQAVARTYRAVCTPDFVGFDADLELQYCGRLDASRTTLVPNVRRELFAAMCLIAETGTGPAEQQREHGLFDLNGPSTPQQRRMVTSTGNNRAGGLDVDRCELGDVRSKKLLEKFSSRTACLAWWSG